MKYVAFLRAVNVGGHNKIKMEDLKKIFVALGYKNVITVIQSGNVIFESTSDSIKSITGEIERELNNFMKKDIRVFVRKTAEIGNLVARNPFGKTCDGDEIKKYVFFLYGEPGSPVEIPFASPGGDVQVILKEGLHVFICAQKIPGKASSPNNMIEKAFGVPATARNWNVVRKIADISMGRQA